MSCHRRMISRRAGFSASVELLNSADFSQVIFCEIDVRYSNTALSKTAIAEKNTKMANGRFSLVVGSSVKCNKCRHNN